VSVRAVPFYCPFCGEQDIRPDDAGSTAWRCDSCERHFDLTVTFLGARSRSEGVAQEEGTDP
jgi:transposase-like protein